MNKKMIVVALAVASFAIGLDARQRSNKMNQNAKQMSEITIDNTKSNKPSSVTLGYKDSLRTQAKIVAAGQKYTFPVKGYEGYVVNSIGVRQGRGPASVVAMDGNFIGKHMVQVVSDKTAGGFSVNMMKANNKGFFGFLRNK